MKILAVAILSILIEDAKKAVQSILEEEYL
jgi:hypothetical protein